MIVECGLGCWVVTLRDHESRLQASVECDQWQDVPWSLHRLLASGKVPWKPFRSFRKKAAKPKDGE